MKWLRAAVATGLTGLANAARRLKEDVLSMAVTVQYEAASEPGAQMGVQDMPPEPFTEKQQRQSRMDGGTDEDGSLREHVAIAPPVEQPHIIKERNRATAENRMEISGTAAYKSLPLTGAFQATFPLYRQRSSFCTIGDVTQLSGNDCDAVEAPLRSNTSVLQIDELGEVIGHLLPNGEQSSPADKLMDANAWKVHFAHDAFNNQCSNHEHSCTDTCVKYVKEKLKAKQSLRSHKVPSCRFWFFRIKRLHVQNRLKGVRRRGKPLVPKPFIEESDDRSQQSRCQVKRLQPFRSASNDVSQVCDRCNVDYQFLPCVPSEVPTPAASGSTTPLIAEVASSAQPPKRRRVTKKSAPMKTPKNTRKWCYGAGRLPAEAIPALEAFSVAFRKAYVMDFYITKYQGKMLESLTPLFQTMLSGTQRLEQEEQQEEEARKLQAATAQHDGSAMPPPKKPKTKEDLIRRARRLCIRLASVANRCFWLSSAEVTVHILTGGDCLQSHRNVRLFTRKLQWMMHQCKRQLNHESIETETSPQERNIQAVTVRARTLVDDNGFASPVEEDDEDDDLEILDVHASAASTSTSDDFAHRGDKLLNMPFYIYRMYVRRILRRGRARAKDPTIFPFTAHYALSSNYVQEIILQNINIPTIDGFQCPTWREDPEQNSLLKALLFTPWQCTDAMTCGHCSMFEHMLSNCSCSATQDAAQLMDPSPRKFTGCMCVASSDEDEPEQRIQPS